MKIEKISIDKLLLDPANARKHGKKNLDSIKGSLAKFGQQKPIVVNAENVIVAGNGTLQAAKELGWKEINIVRTDLKGSDITAFGIADNRTSELAEWDDDVLKELLEGLKAEDFDLSAIGFDDDEFAEMMGGKGNEGLTDADAVPDVPEEPKTKFGDIYRLGNHRLMCGDSTDKATVEKLMDGKRADMVFTDPPYGVEYQSNMRTKSQKFDVLKNDYQFLDITPIVEMFSTGWMFVWTSWKVQTKWIDMFNGFGYPTNIVIWHKPGGGIGNLKSTFISDYEVALVWHRGAELCGKRIGSVWTVNKDGASTYVHPTQKPVALSEEALDKTTISGAVVLDLFGGSGSTLIGCEKTGRNCYMMELDPKFCDVIIKRWEDFTGKKAELLSS